MSSEGQTIGDHQAANASPASLANQLLADAQRVSGKHRPSMPPPLTRVQSGPETQGRYIPSLSLDPGNVKAIEGFDDHSGYVQCAVQAFSTIHAALKRLSDARAQVAKDTSKTEANQILCVATEASKLQDTATRAFDSARKTLTDAIAHTDALLSKPLTTAADNSISAEVRKYVRELPDDKRVPFMNDTMKRGDIATLAAILGAQPFLSGLTHEMKEHFTRQLHERQQPEVSARLKVMRAALNLIEQRSGLIFTEVEKALGARWDVVQQLRKTQSESAAALLLINNPVQQS